MRFARDIRQQLERIIGPDGTGFDGGRRGRQQDARRQDAQQQQRGEQGGGGGGEAGDGGRQREERERGGGKREHERERDDGRGGKRPRRSGAFSDAATVTSLRMALTIGEGSGWQGGVWRWLPVCVACPHLAAAELMPPSVSRQALPTGWRSACPCTTGTARWGSRPHWRRWAGTDTIWESRGEGGGTTAVQHAHHQPPLLRAVTNHLLNRPPARPQLHPSCARVAADDDGLLPEWLVYHELVSTGRVFLSKVRRCCPPWWQQRRRQGRAGLGRATAPHRVSVGPPPPLAHPSQPAAAHTADPPTGVPRGRGLGEGHPAAPGGDRRRPPQVGGWLGGPAVAATVLYLPTPALAPPIRPHMPPTQTPCPTPPHTRPRSGGKTGQKAIEAAAAQASGAAEAEQQRAATAERRNTDDAVAAARARYLARKKAGKK